MKYLGLLALMTLGAVLLLGGRRLAATAAQGHGPEPTPSPALATLEELAAARAEWEVSGHADTYDGGLGANTTCARCKSPRNWDEAAPAAEAAMDCASCKRIPGQARPDLSGGVPVVEEEWHDIGCEICHEPAGASYQKAISFLNSASGSYEAVASTTELCARCHEGRHGFEVVEEQSLSPAHNGWNCARCHGPHGLPASCEDCHDPQEGAGSPEHSRHTAVNCTACHDAGRLEIALETDPSSDFYGTYVTRRFAHTITAWPSHNLQTTVSCRGCHHRGDSSRPAVAPGVGCSATGCHTAGAVLNWCPIFPKGEEPAGWDR